MRKLYNSLFPLAADYDSPMRVIDGAFRVTAAYLIQHPTLYVQYTEIEELLESSEEIRSMFDKEAERPLLVTSVVTSTENGGAELATLLGDLRHTLDGVSMSGIAFSGDEDMRQAFILWAVSEEQANKVTGADYQSITEYVLTTLHNYEVPLLSVSTFVDKEGEISW